MITKRDFGKVTWLQLHAGLIILHVLLNFSHVIWWIAFNYLTVNDHVTSAQLTTVTNVAIATDLVLLEAPRSFALKFTETKKSFSFCLGICFCVKVHSTLYIFWSNLILNCSLSTPAMSNPNGLLSQKVCHYLDQGRTLNHILLRTAYWMADFGLRKLNLV